MNLLRKLLIPLALIAFTTACQKQITGDTDNNNNNGGNGSGTHIVSVRQGVGNSLWGDTVTRITYNGDRIATIYDSLFEPSVYTDTVYVKYGTDGRISSAASNNGDYIYLTWESGGLLTHINVKYNGLVDDYKFFYTNGVLTRKEWLTSDNFGSTVTSLYRFYTYEITNGNITSKKEFNSDGSPRSEQTYTYGTEQNVFKDLSLLNIGNTFGFSFFADYYADEFDTYFNTNLMNTHSINGNQVGTFTKTYNNQQQIIKYLYTTTDGSPYGANVFTYQFSYK
jgi:hypothetical protein